MNKEIKRKIVEDYSNNVSTRKIKKKYHTSYETIKKICKEEGIFVCKYPSYSEELKKKAVFMYANGERPSIIVKKTKTPNSSTLYRWCVKKGIKLRSMEESSRIRFNITIKEDVFDNFTEESLYWIGFISADGTVYKNRLSLGLSKKDKLHVDKFASFLGTNNKKFETKKNMHGKEFFTYGISVSSKKLINRLNELNITANKTFSLDPNKELKNSKYYWRGIIDGDGCITICNTKRGIYPQISLVGSYKVIEKFIDFVNSQIINISNKPRKKGNVYTTSMTHNKAYKIIEYLYENSNIYLERKKERAEEILNSEIFLTRYSKK